MQGVFCRTGMWQRRPQSASRRASWRRQKMQMCTALHALQAVSCPATQPAAARNEAADCRPHLQSVLTTAVQHAMKRPTMDLILETGGCGNLTKDSQQGLKSLA